MKTKISKYENCSTCGKKINLEKSHWCIPLCRERYVTVGKNGNAWDIHQTKAETIGNFCSRDCAMKFLKK